MENFRYFKAIAVIMLSLILLTACGGGQIVLTTGFGEDEVFRVEDIHCSRSEVLLYMLSLRQQYEKAYGSGLWNAGEEGQELMGELKKTALARIGRVKLMNLMAELYQVSLNKEEEKKAAEAANEYYQSLSPEEIAALDGIRSGEVQRLMKEYAVARKLYRELTKDVNIEISDDEARIITLHQIALYVVHTADDGTVIEATIEELKRRAAELKDRIDEGEDFDSLAYGNNEAKELVISFPKGVMPAAVEEACFALAEGEVSDVVATEEGVFLFKCISTYEREQTEERKTELARERQKESFEARYEEFVKDKAYYLNETLWESIQCPETGSGEQTDFFTVYENYFPET
ncbi:MAG: peptidyl-prolyl cis-trans isomerase [Lachnospiraceae bacterium]|nr:peptidyl-prolyl cis-trans isomerase [Lachnospiraceae bacterium]